MFADNTSASQTTPARSELLRQMRIAMDTPLYRALILGHRDGIDQGLDASGRAGSTGSRRKIPT